MVSATYSLLRVYALAILLLSVQLLWPAHSNYIDVLCRCVHYAILQWPAHSNYIDVISCSVNRIVVAVVLVCIILFQQWQT